MRKLLDKIEIVIDKHSIQSTDFLDPYSRRLSKSILNRFDNISYSEDGGLINAERKIISIYPLTLALTLKFFIDVFSF